MSNCDLERRFKFEIPDLNLHQYDEYLLFEIFDEYNLESYKKIDGSYNVSGNLGFFSIFNFNLDMSTSILKFSLIGETHYFDTSKPFNPKFSERKIKMILNRNNHLKKYGALYLDYLERIIENGFRVISNRDKKDIILGFEENNVSFNFYSGLNKLIK